MMFKPGPSPKILSPRLSRGFQGRQDDLSPHRPWFYGYYSTYSLSFPPKKSGRITIKMGQVPNDDDTEQREVEHRGKEILILGWVYSSSSSPVQKKKMATAAPAANRTPPMIMTQQQTPQPSPSVFSSSFFSGSSFFSSGSSFLALWPGV